MQRIREFEQEPLECDFCSQDVHKTGEKYLDVDGTILCEKCFQTMDLKDMAYFLGGEVKEG